MGFLDLIFERDNSDKKLNIDPNKPLKGQLDDNPTSTTVSKPIPIVDNTSENYKKQKAYLEKVFSDMNTGPTSYQEFLSQVEFLKDVISDKGLLYKKAFQIIQKHGGDKYVLQTSAANTLEKIKLEHINFNQTVENKIKESQVQLQRDIDDQHKKILEMEKEINAAKVKLQELKTNIALIKEDLESRKDSYNEISNAMQNEINSNIKDIQTFIN